MKINHRLPAQSLVEVIVAIGVSVILAVSLVTAVLITQKASRSALNNTQAAKLAQQNIEQTRIFRDRNGFAAFPVDDTCYTLDNTFDSDPTNWSFVTSLCPVGEKIPLYNMVFIRKIAIDTDNDNPNKKLITVTVSWNESGVNRTVTNDTFLTKWESP